MKTSIDWYSILYWIAAHVRAVAATVGVTGVGVGLVKILRHAPAPQKNSLWAGCLFDAMQDLASNDSRIGERRSAPGDAASPESAERL
jgi:hypothetical protein